jgi:hypothetical protein
MCFYWILYLSSHCMTMLCSPTDIKVWQTSWRLLMAVFWGVVLFSLVEIDRSFRDTYRLIVLMMEVLSTSETSVNFYQTKPFNSPEDTHLRRLENLKSRFVKVGMKSINIEGWEVSEPVRYPVRYMAIFFRKFVYSRYDVPSKLLWNHSTSRRPI